MVDGGRATAQLCTAARGGKEPRTPGLPGWRTRGGSGKITREQTRFASAVRKEQHSSLTTTSFPFCSVSRRNSDSPDTSCTMAVLAVRERGLKRPTSRSSGRPWIDGTLPPPHTKRYPGSESNRPLEAFALHLRTNVVPPPHHPLRSSDPVCAKRKDW